MPASTRPRLLDAALDVLGTQGGAGFSARAVEDAADVPHGSIRHHFGDVAGLRRAMVERLLELEMPDAPADPAARIASWLGEHRTRTRARYELAVLALGEEPLRAALVSGRDAVVAAAVESGLEERAARSAVAAIDGLVFDALLRGDAAVDPDALALLLPSG